MIVTEKEAEEKICVDWCSASGSTPKEWLYCIASKCMAWNFCKTHDERVDQKGYCGKTENH